MNTPKLTLIFACYNVSPYLENLYYLLKSLPYQNIEVIFVEDCATDDTKEKLFALVDNPRMRIIENSQNLGASESRNIGLKYATGDYVGFPDPDDMFDVNWLVEVSKIIQTYQPQVIVTGMREDYELNNKLQYSKEVLSEYSGFIHEKDDMLKAIVNLESVFLFGFTNNKFYKTSLLKDKGLTYKQLALKEDFEFNIRFFYHVDNIYILNKPYYFYKKRNNNSLTNKFVKDYFALHTDTLYDFKKFLENKYFLSKQAESLIVNRFFRYFLSAIERNHNVASNLTPKEQLEWIRDILLNEKYTYFFENIDLLDGKLKYIRVLIKYKKVYCFYFLGKVINYIKNRFPILFSKIRGNR